MEPIQANAIDSNTNLVGINSPPGRKSIIELIQTNTIDSNANLVRKNSIYFVAFLSQVIHKMITAKETNQSIDA